MHLSGIVPIPIPIFLGHGGGGRTETLIAALIVVNIIALIVGVTYAIYKKNKNESFSGALQGDSYVGVLVCFLIAAALLSNAMAFFIWLVNIVEKFISK